jgi:hypothetical protein
MSFPSSLRALALAGLALLGAAAAHAQSITLWPAMVPLKGDFGQSTTQTLTLRNDTDAPMSFALEARDVEVRNGERVFVEAGKLPESVAASAVFTPSRVDVPARSSASVSVLLTLPLAMKNRAVGAYFRALNPVVQNGRPTFLSLGTLFTFTMSERIAITPETLQIDPPSSSKTLRLHSTVRNSGDEPVVPAGMAVLLDAQGRMVGKVAFAPRRLLPGEKTVLEASYPGELAAGSYRVVSTFDAAGRAYSLSGSVVVP